jgi:hypothetical protein
MLFQAYLLQQVHGAIFAFAGIVEVAEVQGQHDIFDAGEHRAVCLVDNFVVSDSAKFKSRDMEEARGSPGKHFARDRGWVVQDVRI